MSLNPNRRNWTTEDEKNFIDVLGTFAKYPWLTITLEQRLGALKNYRDKTFYARQAWGVMNRKEIFLYVEKKIRRLENGKGGPKKSRMEEENGTG